MTPCTAVDRLPRCAPGVWVGYHEITEIRCPRCCIGCSLQWSELQQLSWPPSCRRDPNKPLVRLYAVPADAFQQDDYDEEPLQDADETEEPATPVAVDDD